jgi:hypothetical protein
MNGASGAEVGRAGRCPGSCESFDGVGFCD